MQRPKEKERQMWHRKPVCSQQGAAEEGRGGRGRVIESTAHEGEKAGFKCEDGDH